MTNGWNEKNRYQHFDMKFNAVNDFKKKAVFD